MSQSGSWTNAIIPGTFVETLTGNTGGPIGPDAGNINVIGAGNITVAGDSVTATLTISETVGPFMWTVVTAGTQSLVANNGYISNNGGTIFFSLPALAAIGDTYRVTGINNNSGWKISQNSGQTVYIGNMQTTTGTAGYLESTQVRDSVEIICVIQNSSFNVLSSIGNILVN